ncbi:MAG: hypothetical protein OEZ06_02570 [Myxococcales bacterium]|nr:hypothetical protein [Myxococcales bacterium]
MFTSRWLLRAVFASIAAIACTPSAEAHPRGPDARFILTVEDAGGRELPTFHHDGHTYVLGEYGDRYRIRVQNRTGRRIEAVVTVDGRDVISGEVGDYVSARGYLVDAHDDIVIEGFRQSMSQVAAFRFTSPADSYSSRMGTPQHVGVIGLAIFRERERPALRRAEPRRRVKARPRPLPEARPRVRSGGRSGASAAPRAAEAPSAGALELDEASPSKGALRQEAYSSNTYEPRRQRQNLGTEYGESQYSEVREVRFRRANRHKPDLLITLRYDDREGLVARGIDLHPYRHYSRRDPDPFPHNNRFAPPPPR